MGTGYTRNDTANNIADGNVINASDLDGEFDAIQAAFNATTGHSHDGTTGEGPQIDTGGLADSAVTTAKINNDAVTLGTKTSGNYVAAGAVSGVGLSGSASSEGATFTVTSNATSANTASTIVARDASGNFSAGTITNTGIATTGNITVSGTVDGRDVSVDGAKLDGIEAGATADQTKADIDALGINAATLDSIDSTQFLRSDAADTKTAGDLSFSDNVKAQFGAGNDLQIYHDGSNSIIRDGGTGNLRFQANGPYAEIMNGGATETMARFNNNGSVDLYYDNSKKLATKSDGVDITGELQADSLDIDGAGDISGNLTLGGNLDMSDNDKILLGTSDDLQIYHDGTNSVIEENSGAGSLIIKGTNISFEDGTGAETYATFIKDGAATIRYDNATKLTTKSDGVDITGELQADSLDIDGAGNISGTLTMGGNIDLQDNDKILLGSGDDLQIYHDGLNSYVKDSGTGDLLVQGTQIKLQDASGNDYLRGFTGGAVYLHHAGTSKFETTATGVDITGELQADSLDIDGAADITGNVTLHANLDLQDNDKILLGSSDDLEIYHDGSNSFIKDSGTGNLTLQTNGFDVVNADATEFIIRTAQNGSVDLYYNNSKKLETTSYGVDISGSVVADTHTASVTGAQTANFSTYQNFVWTLTGNITLSNPTTEKTGQSGFFIFIHSGAARTVSLGTDYETAGGAGLTLSGTAGAVDIVPYVVQSSGNILLGAPQLAFS